MKNRKYLALMITMSLAAGMAACGTNQTTETNTAGSVAAAAESSVESGTVDAEKKTDTVTARVDSISGNTIEVTLGELSGMHGGPNGRGQTPPEKPDGQAPSDANGSETLPEKPDGQAPSDATSSATTSEKPEGQATSDANGSETPPERPDGAPGKMDLSDMFKASEETATYTIDESVLKGITLEDIKEGTILSITLDEQGNVTEVAEAKPEGRMGDKDMQGGMGKQGGPGNMGGPGSSDASSIEYTAVTTYGEDTKTKGETYTSTGTDENAVLVDNGATVTIDKATVTRQSDNSTGGDNASFYGVGAALFAKNGTLYVKDSDITTDAAGGAGIFSYGDSTVYVEDTKITTEQNSSGGIHTAGGGTLYAWDLDVTTNGGSAAAIRSDRGGGTMVIEDGTYTSNGSGSPAVYTTADITIDDASLTANGSEAVCIEGRNTLRLFDCDLTGNMPDDDQNDVTWDVIVYQSMSGDSEVGTGNFSMVGGTLTSKNGGLFYTTNTKSEILLSGVDINYSEDNDFFLQVTGNTNKRGWGSAGANGAECVFTCDNQDAAGKIVYDSISTLDFYLTNASTLTGYFVDDETWAGNGGNGYCNVYVGADSTWVVTDSCSIDALYAAGKVVDEQGKEVTVRGEDGTVYVQGSSEVTVTVSSYSTEDKSANALTTPSYDDYEVAEPTED